MSPTLDAKFYTVPVTYLLGWFLEFFDELLEQTLFGATIVLVGGKNGIILISPLYFNWGIVVVGSIR